MIRTPRFIGMVAVFLFVFAVMSASAQHAAKGNAPGNDEASASGQQVAVDPQSGKIRKPTVEEIQQLISGMKMNDSVEGLSPKIIGNSTVAVDLEGRFESVMIAKINPDGTLSKACVVSAKDAEKFLKSDPSKTKKNDPSTWEVK